jgi:Putative transposase/Transposase zinc-binding domain
MAGAVRTEAACGRVRREPERTVLHALVREHLETFLAESRARSEDGSGWPTFVEFEFRRYLDCGILANGFARVHCGACGHDVLVPFSCKRRGFCPSCNARRMHDTAAHLVDRVIPRVPVRQWVLSLPRWARWMLARDPALASRALALALRAIFADYRRRAGRNGRCGAVTFVQRFGGALNLNVHFHCVVPDGVFLDEGSFLAAPPRSDDEIHAVLARIVRRLERLLEPLRTASNAAPEALDLEYAESVRALPKAPADPQLPKKRTAFIDGFSLHAGVHLHANDREGLEHLCCYGARGPLSLQRLSLTPDGRVCYAMKRPMHGGKTVLVLSPTEFLRKLATLVPPPRGHLVRFHGVFAPHSASRRKVVPVAEAPAVPEVLTAPAPRPPSRIPWAELFKRVFKEDVLRCQKCGGDMKVIAFVNEQEAIRKFLDHLGLPSTGPPIAKARRQPDPDFDFAA